MYAEPDHEEATVNAWPPFSVVRNERLFDLALVSRQFRRSAYEVLYGDLQVPWLPRFVDRLKATLVGSSTIAKLVKKLAAEFWSEMQFIQVETRTLKVLWREGQFDPDEGPDEEEEEDEVDAWWDPAMRPASRVKARYDGWSSAAVYWNTDSKALSELFDVVQHLPRLRSLALHELRKGEWEGGFAPSVAGIVAQLETLVYRRTTEFEPDSGYPSLLDALLLAAPKLRRIDHDTVCLLRRVGQGVVIAPQLPSFPNLRTLHLSSYDPDPLLSISLKTLTTLEIDCVYLHVNHLDELAATLAAAPHLTSLQVHWKGGIDDEQPTAKFRDYTTHSSLEQLRISLTSFPSFTTLLASLPPSLPLSSSFDSRTTTYRDHSFARSSRFPTGRRGPKSHGASWASSTRSRASHRPSASSTTSRPRPSSGGKTSRRSSTPFGRRDST